jgi:hypothetical protein
MVLAFSWAAGHNSNGADLTTGKPLIIFRRIDIRTVRSSPLSSDSEHSFGLRVDNVLGTFWGAAQALVAMRAKTRNGIRGLRAHRQTFKSKWKPQIISTDGGKNFAVSS